MHHLSDQLLSELNTAIKNRQLDSVAQEIISNATECYAMIAVDDDDYSEIGNTRFGGDPDLPIDMPWPVDTDSKQLIYCNFIAQINFAELPPLSFDTGLPSHGILYLFVRYMECAADPVILDSFFYEGSIEELARRQTPDADEMCIEYITDLIPQRIRAEPAISLPNYREKFRNYIRNNTSEINDEDGNLRRIYLECDLNRKGQIGQMLGFANAGDERENLYRQVVLAQLGKRQLVYNDYWDSIEEYEQYIEEYRHNEHMLKNYQNMRPGVEWLITNKKMISDLVDQWKLLFQLNSNSAMDLNINDADPLYVFVKKDDLSREYFSNLAGEVTQG